MEQTQAATPVETEDEDGGLPGFGAVMFIAGFLAAAYIIMRKRG
ncbi:MAG: PGF-CTERM sorting domain-containing protein [Methanosarcinales archaeon]|nr:PGF-CTERM sorting domain-containing protein [Methanosarcinales archaeon]